MHNCTGKNCEETQGSIMTKSRFGQRNRYVKQAHWENLTCCLASHMQEVKAIYFCSVNCIAFESLVLDYPLARCCPNSEQYPWCVILMKKSKISKGNLTSIEDQGFRAMVIKSAVEQTPGILLCLCFRHQHFSSL